MKGPREQTKDGKGKPSKPPGGGAAGRAYQFELEHGTAKSKQGKVKPDESEAGGGKEKNEAAE